MARILEQEPRWSSIISNPTSRGREWCWACLEHGFSQLQHNNYISFCRICVITLAEAHPLLQSGKTIKSINYQISANCSRLQNKVSGKSKRVWLFGLVSFPFTLSHCLKLSVLSRLQTCQVTFAFYFKTAPPWLKNTDFFQRCLFNCPSQGPTVLLQHRKLPVGLKPRLTLVLIIFFS